MLGHQNFHEDPSQQVAQPTNDKHDEVSGLWRAGEGIGRHADTLSEGDAGAGPAGEGITFQDFAARVRVGKIRGGDERTLVVAAVCNDGRDRIFLSIGDAVRTEIVQQ